MSKKGFYVLRENKRKTTIRYVLFFDTETKQIKHNDKIIENEFYIGYLELWDLKREVMIDSFFFETIDEFYKYLYFLSKRFNKKKVYVFAHNMGFDFAVMKFIEYFDSPIWKIKKAVMNSQNFIFIVKNQETKTTLAFVSTTNFFKFSLEKIGKMLGYPKLEIDYSKIGYDLSEEFEDRLRRYLKRDVEILREMFFKYYKFLEEHDLGNFGLTIAQQSLNAFRHRFMKHQIFIHRNERAIQLELDSYRGGRTEAFYLGKVENVVYLDVNSLYPTVMFNNPAPTKLLYYRDYITMKKFWEIHHSSYGYIVEVLVKVDKSLVGVKRKIGKPKTEKLIFPIGKFWAVLTKPEVELILEYGGKILGCRRIAVYEMEYIFRDYIKFFYELKKEYTKQGNKIWRMITKLFLNSLYGKFGQKNPFFEEVNETPLGDGYYAMKIYNADKKKWEYYIGLGKKKLKKKGKKLSHHSFPAIASYITALARVFLTKAILELERKGIKVYYCDTDSVVIEKKNIPEKFLGEELGKWKIEKEGNIWIRGIKDYVFYERNGKVEEKLKGIRKNAKKISENEFEQEQFLSVIGILNLLAKAVVQKFGMFVLKIRKKVKRIYDKGIVGKDGKIKPIMLFEE